MNSQPNRYHNNEFTSKNKADAEGEKEDATASHSCRMSGPLRQKPPLVLPTGAADVTESARIRSRVA